MYVQFWEVICELNNDDSWLYGPDFFLKHYNPNRVFASINRHFHIPLSGIYLLALSLYDSEIIFDIKIEWGFVHFEFCSSTEQTSLHYTPFSNTWLEIIFKILHTPTSNFSRYPLLTKDEHSMVKCSSKDILIIGKYLFALSTRKFKFHFILF